MYSNPGQYTDPETGLIYLRNRYYDPNTAQFLTSDPLLAQTRSAYGDVDNNPLNGTDPSGLCFIGIFGKHCDDVGSHGSFDLGLILGVGVHGGITWDSAGNVGVEGGWGFGFEAGGAFSFGNGLTSGGHSLTNTECIFICTSKSRDGSREFGGPAKLAFVHTSEWTNPSLLSDAWKVLSGSGLAEANPSANVLSTQLIGALSAGPADTGCNHG